jgi:anti-sigma B factor antagonist
LHLKPDFSIEQALINGCHRLLVSGELDLATSPELERALTRLCLDGASEIEIDLRSVRFIDSTGLRTLLLAKDLCAEHGAEFFVIPSDNATQRKLFEVTRVTELLPWRGGMETTGSDS